MRGLAEMQAAPAGVEDIVIEEQRVQAEYVRGSLTGPYHLTVTEEGLAYLMEEGKLQVTTKEGTVELDVMILNEQNEMVSPARSLRLAWRRPRGRLRRRVQEGEGGA